MEAIEREFGDTLQIRGEKAGMHMTVTLPAGSNDREIAQRAAQNNVWLWPLSQCYLTAAVRHGFILGFGSTAVAEIPRAVAQMKQAIQAERCVTAEV